MLDVLERRVDVLDKFGGLVRLALWVHQLLCRLANSQIAYGLESPHQPVDAIDHWRHCISNIVQHLGRRIGFACLERLRKQRLSRLVNLGREDIELSGQQTDLIATGQTEVCGQIATFANLVHVIRQ